MGERLVHGNEIEEGRGRSIPADEASGRPQLLFVRLDGEIRAYIDRCSHFGVPLGVTSDYGYLRDGAIVCQVHYARYAFGDGSCLRGDCDGDGLTPFPFSVDQDGWLVAGS